MGAQDPGILRRTTHRGPGLFVLVWPGLSVPFQDSEAYKQRHPDTSHTRAHYGTRARSHGRSGCLRWPRGKPSPTWKAVGRSQASAKDRAKLISQELQLPVR
jgi:hypothetical protein